MRAYNFSKRALPAWAACLALSLILQAVGSAPSVAQEPAEESGGDVFGAQPEDAAAMEEPAAGEPAAEEPAAEDPAAPAEEAPPEGEAVAVSGTFVLKSEASKESLGGEE